MSFSGLSLCGFPVVEYLMSLDIRFREGAFDRKNIMTSDDIILCLIR